LLDLAQKIFYDLRTSGVQMGTRSMGMRFATIGVLLLCAIAMQARAATITVTNTNDSGPGSLRQALAIANDGDTINFAVTGTIVLTSGGLVIDKDVTISGPGSDQLSIDGNQAEVQCVFNIVTGNTVISGLTITNGICGIGSDHSTLTVRNCIVTANGSYGGIGINDSHGPATPVERGNDRRDAKKAYGDHAFGGHSLTIANSIISGNSGPGVYNNSATVTILNSTITGNSTGQDWGYGGGIDTEGGEFPGNVTVTNSTISGNSAFYGGGGISCGFSALTIANSTISGNSTADPDYGYGGGIAGDATIANSTISGNSASYAGGGIFGSGDIRNSTFSGNSAPSGGGIYNNFSGLVISNTILNAGASGENIFNNGGTVTSHGYNVCSDNGGGYLNGPGDQINTDPLLGPLQNNGGPTLTHALLPGSPAIDAGDPNFTPPPFHDQRGLCFLRVFNGRIDVGSFEWQPPSLRPCPTPRPRPTPAPRPTPH
jgi:hypothetical protein